MTKYKTKTGTGFENWICPKCDTVVTNGNLDLRIEDVIYDHIKTHQVKTVNKRDYESYKKGKL